MLQMNTSTHTALHRDVLWPRNRRSCGRNDCVKWQLLELTKSSFGYSQIYWTPELILYKGDALCKRCVCLYMGSSCKDSFNCASYQENVQWSVSVTFPRHILKPFPFVPLATLHFLTNYLRRDQKMVSDHILTFWYSSKVLLFGFELPTHNNNKKSIWMFKKIHFGEEQNTTLKWFQSQMWAYSYVRRYNCSLMSKIL